MNKYISLPLIILLLILFSCKEVLDPKPVDILTDDVVLNEPADVEPAVIGLYNAFRSMASPVVIAGDFTADMLVHNGTFNQYRELSTKEITPANAAVEGLWNRIYRIVYLANFIIERVPQISGVPTRQREEALAVAHFLRGYAYFIGSNTYGGIPIILSTEVDNNQTVPRDSKEDVLSLVLSDYEYALPRLPEKPANPGFVGKGAVQAALARFHLYQKNWEKAEEFATQVIESGNYTLETEFASIVNEDFTDEAILEVGYSVSDDPGTGTFSLNDLFIGRREIIPSNQVLIALNSSQAGERVASAGFEFKNVKGNDNGWSVLKYGSADEDNNNVVIFRLAEMYLIRAEARAQQGKISGAGSAEEDINVLRTRAKAPLITATGQSQILDIIQQERVYELAFEGHRWYDLVRTGRANTVMNAFSPNWREAYLVWPIPQSEIQNNPALVGKQNIGY